MPRAIGEDPDWWQPIQITMPNEDAKDRGLSFTIGGGFARAEARSVAANLDIVGTLLRRAARNIDIDGSPISPGRILFELLWPNSLKQRSAEEQNRRLIRRAQRRLPVGIAGRPASLDERRRCGRGGFDRF